MKRIVGLLAFTSVIGMANAAQPPELFNNHAVGVAVSDDILSAQRGKFVSSQNQNHYFGIEFVTSIAGPNNLMINRSMQLTVDFSQGQPNIGMYINSPDAQATTNQNNLGATAPNGSGIIQGAQIAGNGNVGINDFIFIPEKITTQGTSLQQGHYQVALPDGVMNYAFNNNGLGMMYTSSDGETTATQMLRNNNNNKGFVQHFNIKDHGLQVSNQTKFYMGEKTNAYIDLAKTLQQQLPVGF